MRQPIDTWLRSGPRHVIVAYDGEAFKAVLCVDKAMPAGEGFGFSLDSAIADALNDIMRRTALLKGEEDA